MYFGEEQNIDILQDTLIPIISNAVIGKSDSCWFGYSWTATHGLASGVVLVVVVGDGTVVLFVLIALRTDGYE